MRPTRQLQTERHFLKGLHSLIHHRAQCRGSELNYTPSLSIKEAYLLVLELWNEGQLLGCHKSRDLLRCSPGTETSGALFVLFLCFDLSLW